MRDKKTIEAYAEYDRLYGGKPEDTLDNFINYMDKHHKHEPTQDEIVAADAHYEAWKKRQQEEREYKARKIDLEIMEMFMHIRQDIAKEKGVNLK